MVDVSPYSTSLTRHTFPLATMCDMSTLAGVSEQDWQLQRDAGISQADFSVLIRLSESNGQRLRTGELAELLAWEKSRVSHQVTRMEARDLLERTECDTDGRGTWVGLTDEGRRVLESASGDHAGAIRE